MKKFWKVFWKSLTAILNSILSIAEAAEAYAADIRDEAKFSSEKSEARRERKRATWTAKQQP